MSELHRLEIAPKAHLSDALGEQTKSRIKRWLGFDAQRIRTRKVYCLDLGLTGAEAKAVADALTDPVAEHGVLGTLPCGDAPCTVVTVGFLPGVTDAVGRTVARACEDIVGRPLQGHAYASRLYLIEGLSKDQVERVTREVLHNPLIERARVEAAPHKASVDVPRAGSANEPKVGTVRLTGLSDPQLLEVSRTGMLALNLEEMKAIVAHFEGLGRDPTDAELECLAQTWSEHCKHKIFASTIRYQGPEGTREIPGLFKTYVRGVTESVAKARLDSSLDPADAPFLVSVFHDNAGVVRFSEEDHLVYKVETHNSPSALDPYGGAMTGIVGVNRDSFGTGIGADLLTNVWGYCFGDPTRDVALPPGLMPPRRIRDGVHAGVIDGGNHSGIPYSRGFELFDDRYAGKPLVYCGTAAVMPATRAGRPTHEKPVRPGDAVIMVGGRIGKDGIHGATFSSVELDEDSPVQAVQIGDPLVQRMMFDMLTEAAEAGLISGMTDNGAGGLSSSVGEMAELTGGVTIDLESAPLKYPGLAPWEILISEAQERMTIAVRPDDVEAFLALARRREVEATVLGTFTESGRFEVRYGEQSVCDLSLDFLHGGVPLPTLEARWEPLQGRPLPQQHADLDLAGVAALTLSMLATPHLASGEGWARHYDHEVKGLSVVKPYIGVYGDVPSTATVLRARHGRDEGVVLGEGVAPFLSDLDTKHMALAVVDEAVRRVLCAGARYDRLAGLDNFCWPDPIVSDKNPDGRHKLAQLVRSCEGLYEACTALGVPLISGKDSMKNDAYLGGVKISIPPTLLVSVIGQMRDVTAALTLEPRAGQQLYLLGDCSDALAGSRAVRHLLPDEPKDDLGTLVETDIERNAADYGAFVAARDAGLIACAHATGRGGLLVALTHMALAADLGLDVRLDGLGASTVLGAALGEATGRIIMGVEPGHVARFEQAMAGRFKPLGWVEAESSAMRVRWQEAEVELELAALRDAFAGEQA